MAPSLSRLLFYALFGSIAIALLGGFACGQQDPILRSSGLYFSAYESLDYARNFTSSGQPYFLVVGTNGTLLVFDSTYSLVSNQTTLDSVSPAISSLPLDPSRLAQARGYSDNLSREADECTVTYSNFEKGVSLCYDNSGRFQCGYLYDKGIWRGILDFDISQTRAAIEYNLPLVASYSRNISALLKSPQFSSANYVRQLNSSSVLLAGSVSSFSAAHLQMLSYRRFATDGALDNCKVFQAEFIPLNSLIGVFVELKSPQLDSLLKGFAKNAAAMPTASRLQYIYARSSLDKYFAVYSDFKARFEAVSGLSPKFAMDDQARLQVLLSAIRESLNASSATIARASFDDEMTNATSRINAADDTLTSYKRARDALARVSADLDSQAALNPGSQPLSDAQRKAFNLNLTLAIKGLSLQNNANVSAQDFQNIEQQAGQIANFSAAQSGAAPTPSAAEDSFFSPTFIAATTLAVLFVALFLFMRGRTPPSGGGGGWKLPSIGLPGGQSGKGKVSRVDYGY